MTKDIMTVTEAGEKARLLTPGAIFSKPRAIAQSAWPARIELTARATAEEPVDCIE